MGERTRWRRFCRRGCWTGGWTLAGLGFVAAFVFAEWETLLKATALTAGVVTSAYLNVALFEQQFGLRVLANAALWSSRAAFVVIAATGYVLSTGWGTAFVIGLVAAAAAYCRATKGEQPPPRLPAELTDEQLCQAWRSSFSQLTASSDLEDRQALADLRGRYLDEFARRSPDAFADWIRTSSGAAAEPSRFFLGSRAGHDPG